MEINFREKLSNRNEKRIENKICKMEYIKLDVEDVIETGEEMREKLDRGSKVILLVGEHSFVPTFNEYNLCYFPITLFEFL